MRKEDVEKISSIFHDIKSKLFCSNRYIVEDKDVLEKDRIPNFTFNILKLILEEADSEFYQLFADSTKQIATELETKPTVCNEVGVFFYCILSAILTEACISARCIEFAHVGLMRLLKNNIRHIELLEVQGSDGRFFETHSFLFIRVDDTPFYATNPKTWRGYLFDPWGQDDIIILDTQTPITPKTLSCGEFTVEKIIHTSTFNRPFAQIHRYFLYKLLNSTKGIIADSSLLQVAYKHSERNPELMKKNLEIEKQAILKGLQQEIDYLKLKEEKSEEAPVSSLSPTHLFNKHTTDKLNQETQDIIESLKWKYLSPTAQLISTNSENIIHIKESLNEKYNLKLTHGKVLDSYLQQYILKLDGKGISQIIGAQRVMVAETNVTADCETVLDLC